MRNCWHIFAVKRTCGKSDVWHMNNNETKDVTECLNAFFQMNIWIQHM